MGGAGCCCCCDQAGEARLHTHTRRFPGIGAVLTLDASAGGRARERDARMSAHFFRPLGWEVANHRNRLFRFRSERRRRIGRNQRARPHAISCRTSWQHTSRAAKVMFMAIGIHDCHIWPHPRLIRSSSRSSRRSASPSPFPCPTRSARGFRASHCCCSTPRFRCCCPSKCPWRDPLSQRAPKGSL